MSKAVLISINPKWVHRILDGKKTVEVRKTAPKIETPFKVYMYETKGETEIPWVDEDGHFVYQGRGEVVAEFPCTKIHKVDNNGSQFSINNDIALTNRIGARSRLDFDDVKRYLGTKDGYAWEIENLKLYDQPKELSDFVKPTCIYGEGNEQCTLCDKSGYNKDMRLTCYNIISRAPQSWCYVEEL